ncbi:MAG: hypothetical protein ABSD92_01435 [Candidatus Bathyarchaeia archaeon]|jgi:hypothetical protein
MVQQGQATTIYIAKEEYKRYQTIVKEKLGKKAGPRIVELIRQDVANLEGKPVIDNNEDINELQTRLKSLTKEDDDVSRILEQHGVLDDLYRLANNSPYNISFKPHPDKAKKAIAMMVTDFNAKKLRVQVDLGDFQLFIGLAELHIEYCKVLSRLAELRAQKYTADPTQTPETEAPQIEAQPTESAEIKQVAEEAEGQEPEVKANNKQSILEEPESEEEEEGAGEEKEDKVEEPEEPEPGEDEPNDDYVLESAEEKEEEEPWLD